MTIRHIKKINGPYKLMVLVFSLLGIIFSVWELIARPFAHSYNKGLAYFSMNTWLESHDLLEFLLVGYASFYLVILAIIAVQFVFRYATLCKPSMTRRFGGCSVIIWMTYIMFSGAVYGGSLYYLCSPDEFSDHYMRRIIYDYYNLSITHIPRFMIVPYALVVQTIVPILLFVLPIAPFLVGPLLDIEMNFPAGWMYVILCLYPPIDTITYMLIVSEYKRTVLVMLRPVLPKGIKLSTEISTSTAIVLAR
uniref:G_PROTEIN_RECEP_F1_2 domain-containing protein n=1 Tax=Caenorhabditis tropicalis TaxID=1561998 RepID=A0A1I7T7N6_9PELO